MYHVAPRGAMGTATILSFIPAQSFNFPESYRGDLPRPRRKTLKLGSIEANREAYRFTGGEMTTVQSMYYLSLFIFACAAPVLLAVLICKGIERLGKKYSGSTPEADRVIESTVAAMGHAIGTALKWAVYLFLFATLIAIAVKATIWAWS
jgi:hypothetical protein